MAEDVEGVTVVHLETESLEAWDVVSIVVVVFLSGFSELWLLLHAVNAIAEQKSAAVEIVLILFIISFLIDAIF